MSKQLQLDWKISSSVVGIGPFSQRIPRTESIIARMTTRWSSKPTIPLLSAFTTQTILLQPRVGIPFPLLARESSSPPSYTYRTKPVQAIWWWHPLRWTIRYCIGLAPSALLRTIPPLPVLSAENQSHPKFVLEAWWKCVIFILRSSITITTLPRHLIL